MGFSEDRERRKGAGWLFEELMAENDLNLREDLAILIQMLSELQVG